MTFRAIWLVEAARLSGDNYLYWLPSDYNIFFQNGGLTYNYHEWIHREFGFYSMQQRTKKDNIYEKYLTKNL